MARRIGQNLRRGHRAEGMGVELLRGLCAVAPIPQEDDYGLDAVCTLLRAESGMLLPEGSAFVQIKAASVRELRLDENDYRWLRALELPSFIASVDLDEQAIELHSTHNVASRIDARSHPACVMYLDPTPCKIENNILHQHLGPPALKWSRADCDDPDVRAQLYDTLKAWLKLEGANIRTRSIHTVQALHWTTNVPPTVRNYGVVGHGDDLERDLAELEPYLLKLISHLVFAKTDEEQAALAALLVVISWAKGKVPKTEKGGLEQLALALLKHQIVERSRQGEE